MMSRVELIALMAAILEAGDRAAEQAVDVSACVQPSYYVNRALDLFDVTAKHPALRPVPPAAAGEGAPA